MSLVSRFRRLTMEDFPGAPAWAEQLFLQLNEALLPVTEAFARRLTRHENMLAGYRELTITTRDTPADAFPVVVKVDVELKPSAVWVGKVEVLKGQDAQTAAVGFRWRVSERGGIEVLAMPGLEANCTYRVTLVYE
jgi:hypothetical protein